MKTGPNTHIKLKKKILKKETHKNQKKHFGQYCWLVIIREPYVSNLVTWTVAFFLPFQVPWKASQLCRFTPFPPETSIFLVFQFSFGIFYSPTSPIGLFSLINLLLLLLSIKKGFLIIKLIIYLITHLHKFFFKNNFNVKFILINFTCLIFFYDLLIFSI